MAKLQLSPKYSVIIAVGAFVVAAISFFGIILKNDLVGRLIFGITWSLVGVGWLGCYFNARKTSKSHKGIKSRPRPAEIDLSLGEDDNR